MEVHEPAGDVGYRRCSRCLDPGGRTTPLTRCGPRSDSFREPPQSRDAASSHACSFSRSEVLRSSARGRAAQPLGAHGPPVVSTEFGGCGERCRPSDDGCSGPWCAGARRLHRSSHMPPISPASPADRYGKGVVAETENKAKKKLVSITTETSM
jgi:hypothetical protein